METQTQFLKTKQTYVVPDKRKGVRTPSTRTMFFTPGRASVFLLSVCTEKNNNNFINANSDRRISIILMGTCHVLLQ